jgi:hypothetical protein
MLTTSLPPNVTNPWEVPFSVKACFFHLKHIHPINYPIASVDTFCFCWPGRFNRLHHPHPPDPVRLPTPTASYAGRQGTIKNTPGTGYRRLTVHSLKHILCPWRAAITPKVNGWVFLFQPSYQSPMLDGQNPHSDRHTLPLVLYCIHIACQRFPHLRCCKDAAGNSADVLPSTLRSVPSSNCPTPII